MPSVKNLPIFKKITIVLGAFALLAVGSACFASYNMRAIDTAYPPPGRKYPLAML